MYTTDHTVSQQLGARTHQADAAAHHHNPITGHTAWVLLDGIGDREHVAAWTPRTALALAGTAAVSGTRVRRSSWPVPSCTPSAPTSITRRSGRRTPP